MADLESNHGDENNLNNEDFHDHQPILEISEIICNLLGVVHYHASFFSINANNFNFKSGMISLFPKFHGLDYENPYLHFNSLFGWMGSCGKYSRRRESKLNYFIWIFLREEGERFFLGGGSLLLLTPHF